MLASEALPCGWSEYPFWRCSRGPRYDLRVDPERQMRGEPLPRFCPGCGAPMALARE